MSLAAALDDLAAHPRAGGLPCPVATYLAGLAGRDPALHARVLGMVDDEGIQASRLAAVLSTDGARFSPPALRRHRKRGTGADACRCAR